MFSELRSLRRLLPLLHTPWRRALLAVFFGVVAISAAIGLSAVSAWLIARASQRPLILDLTVAVVAVRALGISRGVFRYFDRIFSHDVALRGVEHLREQTYLRLAQAPTHLTIGLRRGDLLARFGADIDAIGDVVVRAVMPVVVAVVTSIGSVILIWIFSPRTALVLALALIIAGSLAPAAAARAAWRSERATVHARADVASATMSVVDHATDLRVSGRLAGVMAELSDAETRLRRALRRASWPAALAPSVSTLAMGASIIAALYFGSQELAAGELSAVSLAVITLTPLAVFEAIEALPGAAVQTLHSAAAAHRLADLLLTPAEQTAGEAANLSVPATIEARNLAIGYPGNEPILQGIDLDLHPGDTLAIIGASGIGKTTLLATLAGLLPPLSGHVLLRGQDTRDLAPGEAAKTALFTAEDAHVFDTTIMENLRVARGDITEEEATNALISAGLEEFFAGLPEGLDTRLGENATMISGGERRRLLLARSLLAPAPLLLLDEPGEHLDMPTADALTASFLDLAKTAEQNRGVIVVTHRLPSVTSADRVIELQ